MAIETIGLRTSLWNNNAKSIILLILLPLVLCVMIWVIVFSFTENTQDALYGTAYGLVGVGIWFAIAYLFQEQMMMSMAHATAVDRKTYPELYNLTENLAIASGIKMPSLYIMDTDALNAFASGLSVDKASICVTRALVEKLDPRELEAVLAHEMSHILHRDMRLLTIAILFVGIIAFIAEVALRSSRRGRNNKKGNQAIVLILIVSAVGYLIAILSKFAISRRREYMADAGSVVLTKDKDAMISALEKISGRSEIEDAPSDLRFMLFDNSQSYLGLFDTHPSVEKRIEALKKY